MVLSLVQPQHLAPGARSAPGAGLVPFVTTDMLLFSSRLLRLGHMRRAVAESAKHHQQELIGAGNRWRPVLITLTYRDEVKWLPEQIGCCLDAIREYLRRRGHKFRYVWVMELTKRGVPHYHVVTWLPRGLTLPKPDKRGWWPHGMTRIEWARSPIGYLIKYASKGINGQFSIPPGARLHGCGGLDLESRLGRAWSFLPKYAKNVFTPEDRARRVKGGGFSSILTGEIVKSDFIFIGFFYGAIALVPRPVLLW